MENEKRETQVTIQMSELKEVISELEKSITGLRDKLKVVLRNDLISDSEKDKVKEEKLVPLATDLREIRFQINHLNILVLDILRELEL